MIKQIMITIKDVYQSNIIVQCKDVGISVFGIHPRAIYYVGVAIMYLYMIHIKNVSTLLSCSMRIFS